MPEARRDTGTMSPAFGGKWPCPACHKALATGEAYVREPETYTYWHRRCYDAALIAEVYPTGRD